MVSRCCHLSLQFLPIQMATRISASSRIKVGFYFSAFFSFSPQLRSFLRWHFYNEVETTCILSQLSYNCIFSLFSLLTAHVSRISLSLYKWREKKVEENTKSVPGAKCMPYSACVCPFSLKFFASYKNLLQKCTHNFTSTRKKEQNAYINRHDV